MAFLKTMYLINIYDKRNKQVSTCETILIQLPEVVIGFKEPSPLSVQHS